jgi:enoyl-CoA hydratase/carnithine racemase
VLHAVEEAGRRDDVKAIVLQGEGPDFCAGFDVTDPADFEGSPDEPRRARIASIREKADWMRELLGSTKPLVVSVHGNCVGIGFYFVLVADFAVASSDAGFGLPEERFGSAGATWSYPYLIREVGLKRANEIVMTGRRFAADEIQAFGLVNRVVARDDLDACTADLARSICSLPREGIAINRAVKQLALSTSGHLAAFAVHQVAHPLAERLRRESDEFDFMALIERDGMRSAVAERNRRFAGDWWGW